MLTTPEASAWVESVDDFWVTLNMAAWINQNDTSIVLARSEAIRLTQAAFDAEGIAAPVPSYRIESFADAAPKSKEAQSTAALKPTPAAPPPAQEVNATADKELAKIVDQERAEQSRRDLLNINASEE